VALDNVAAKARAGLQRAFEIEGTARPQSAEAGTAQSLGRDVGAEAGGLRIDDGQADAVDRDAVAGAQAG